MDSWFCAYCGNSLWNECVDGHYAGYDEDDDSVAAGAYGYAPDDHDGYGYGSGPNSPQASGWPANPWDKLALNADVEDDGTYKRTRFVTKANEDHCNVQHPKIKRKGHCKQGASVPPLPAEHRFGI